jgi:hypothetical protein
MGEKLVNPFFWKRDGKKFTITSLGDLLQVLITIPQENIDAEIKENVNKGKMLEWVQENFPEKIKLIASLRHILDKFTSQQIREMLIRELREITSVS